MAAALLSWAMRRRAELQLAARLTVAGLAAFVVARLLALPQGYWAVFTAVLVTQASVGGSLTAARDRLIGTVGGAGYSAFVAAAVPHAEPWSLGLALGLALGPLSVLAALNPVFKVAPVTAVILMLGTAGTEEGPILAAVLRTVEVCIGGFIGLLVSVLVLPKRGAHLVFETAQAVLARMVTLESDLFMGLRAPLEPAAISAQHERIQALFDKLEAAAGEAERERRSWLSEALDLAPVPRTLRRLYHDLVLIGRVAANPLVGTDEALLKAAIAETATFFSGVGDALVQRAQPPPSEKLEAALLALAAQTRSVQSAEDGGEEARRRAALSFALEQLVRDARDLSGRTQECARDTGVIG